MEVNANVKQPQIPLLYRRIEYQQKEENSLLKYIFQYYYMGTDPYQYKMPNRNMGMSMGKPDPPIEDVNIQKAALDPTTNNDVGMGTNFEHAKKVKDEDNR